MGEKEGREDEGLRRVGGERLSQLLRSVPSGDCDKTFLPLGRGLL